MLQQDHFFMQNSAENPFFLYTFLRHSYLWNFYHLSYMIIKKLKAYQPV